MLIVRRKLGGITGSSKWKAEERKHNPQEQTGRNPGTVFKRLQVLIN